jgi:hypothetical protein
MGYPNPAGLSLKIEPVLFEWTGWYPDKLPQFMAPSELADSGFDIDTSYEPFQKVSDLECDEPVNVYYERTHKFVQHLIEKDGNFIFHEMYCNISVLDFTVTFLSFIYLDI